MIQRPRSFFLCEKDVETTHCSLVRPPGFGPGLSAWEADVLARLDYGRFETRFDALSLYERFVNKGVVYSCEVSRRAIQHCLRKCCRERISGKEMKHALKAP